MQYINAAFPLKQIVSGILLSFCAFQAYAEPFAPEAAVYAEEWLPVYPQVSVNGSTAEGLFKFMSYHGRLFVQADTLVSLGIRTPPSHIRQAKQAEGKVADTDGTAASATNTDSATSEPETELAAAERPSENQAEADGQSPTHNQAHQANNTTAANKPSSGWIELETIPELEVQYDAAAQTLALTAPLAWLNLPVTHIGKEAEHAYEIARPGFAGVLNYDYNMAHNGNGGTGHGLLAESRFTTPIGYLSHNHLWNQHKENQRNVSKNVRLDTYWRSTWPEQGLVLTVGDVLAGQLGGSGSRLGGVKLEHTYRTQPWRNTAPLRSYLGETTLPGTVDLYLNGVKQYSQDVAAGSYEITLPPSISGSGTAQVVATDVLGRQVVVDLPLYRGTGMLAKGLNEWSLEAGYLRRGYGIHQFDYDKKLVGSGAVRYGISHFLTGQLHAQGGGGYRQFGAAANTVIGSLGQLNLSYAQSRFKQHKGAQSSVFFSTQKGPWSFGAGWSHYGNSFSELSRIIDQEEFQPEPGHTRTASTSLGWSSPKLGAFALSYLHNKRSAEQQTDKIGTFNWNFNIGKRIGVYLNAAHNFNNSEQRSIYGGVSLSLDKGYSANAGSHRDGGNNQTHRISLSKSSAGLGSPYWNIGWQQQSSSHAKRQGHLNGYLNYDTQYGDFRGSVYNTRGVTNWNAGVRGGIVLMRGDVFATRTVNDSFAVVSAGGMADVPVMLFNNTVGKTNRKGLLLVPNLSAYQKNTLDIDITDLPQNVQAERSRVQAVPTERSGVAVDFKFSIMRAASLTLKYSDGLFVKDGSVINREDGTPVAVVGFDGRAFIEHLAEGRNRFTVRLPENGGECRFDIDYRAEQYKGSLPDLGETICTNSTK
ncbi:fimbria/pilus outer membrane usher protein [Neisseria sp. Dent CA1/247]|uniref:fimbria/pilus outer membrane usher protein n=1 Tax=Neisseria sp. Dent CA1/247 TaxID=2912675 RepID=UPI001FD2CFD9|nr:fimbria/pilus outer membrane usher protein [Neisseria sp. Dent CA1/247]UOO76844.1 fimbria/pilus outer membrane usher protein [Neisseria sp. Dent CA1/247]